MRVYIKDSGNPDTPDGCYEMNNDGPVDGICDKESGLSEQCKAKDRWINRLLDAVNYFMDELEKRGVTELPKFVVDAINYDEIELNDDSYESRTTEMYKIMHELSTFVADNGHFTLEKAVELDQIIEKFDKLGVIYASRDDIH